MSHPDPQGQPPEHIPYEVLSTHKRPMLREGGHFEDVHEVHFRGPSGAASYALIPHGLFNPAHVDNVIQEELARVEGVHALGPEPHPENLAPGH